MIVEWKAPMTSESYTSNLHTAERSVTAISFYLQYHMTIHSACLRSDAGMTIAGNSSTRSIGSRPSDLLTDMKLASTATSRYIWRDVPLQLPNKQCTEWPRGSEPRHLCHKDLQFWVLFLPFDCILCTATQGIRISRLLNNGDDDFIDSQPYASLHAACTILSLRYLLSPKWGKYHSAPWRVSSSLSPTLCDGH